MCLTFIAVTGVLDITSVAVPEWQTRQRCLGLSMANFPSCLQ